MACPFIDKPAARLVLAYSRFEDRAMRPGKIAGRNSLPGEYGERMADKKEADRKARKERRRQMKKHAVIT